MLDSPGKIFDCAKRFGGSAAQRRSKRYEFTKQVRTLARQHWDDDELHRFIVTHKNAAFDLSLCVVDPEAHTTNNAAERPLRKPVALRKIQGGLRAAASVPVMPALLACKAT